MYSDRLIKRNWKVITVSLEIAQKLVAQYHYSKGGSNTATYRHGLFRADGFFYNDCLGVAWWIPPTKSAAMATYPENWKGVLMLSRLVISPEVPKNGASFLLGRSMKMIDRERWPCLVTYADEMMGHTGGIYRATNWEYIGKTKPENAYFLNGRMISRKAGPKTKTKSEMLAMGCELVGKYSKHKFTHVVEPREREV